MRKYEAIDLLKLYSQGNHKAWNMMLTRCQRQLNINELAKVRYQIQAGMDDLAKTKMNTEEIIVWYCRLISSLEKTARRILRIKHPLPGDNPLIAKNHLKELDIKRKRDNEFKKFLHDSSY